MKPLPWGLSIFLSAAALAQAAPPQRTLADLEAAFEKEWRETAAPDMTREQYEAMVERHAQELAAFLESEAKGRDRFNGRLMLTDMRLSLRQKDRAEAVLRELDAESAPPLVLLVAADLATRMRLMELRETWIAKALAKDAPFEERMAMATLLMTALVQVEKGEKIFEDALAAAEDDEERAKVYWFRAGALREREDLPEGAYYEALEALAEELPDTYYGGVARDRLVAAEFETGKPAIPFEAVDLSGNEVSLDSYRGKVLLLHFWAPWHPPSREEAPELLALYGKYADEGLAVLGIAMDEDVERVKESVGELGFPWRQVCDGRGMQADLALRYHVETVPTIIVVGRDGKIIGLNHHFGTDDAEEALREDVEKGIKANG